MYARVAVFDQPIKLDNKCESACLLMSLKILWFNVMKDGEVETVSPFGDLGKHMLTRAGSSLVLSSHSPATQTLEHLTMKHRDLISYQLIGPPNERASYDGASWIQSMKTQSIKLIDHREKSHKPSMKSNHNHASAGTVHIFHHQGFICYGCYHAQE